MRIKFVFLLLIASRISYSQSYLPMPLGNGKWTETEYSMAGAFYDHSFCHFSIDTNKYTFSGHPYYKIELVGDSVYNVAKLQKSTYLYDDTVNRKVYIQASGEKLIYDFSKNVGDTVRNIYCSSIQNEVTFVVDSIVLKTLHGINRRVFYLRDTFAWVSYPTIWIEGIGSPIGLFKNSYRCILSDPAYALNCVHQNGHQIYGGVCEFKVVGLNDYKISLGKIKIVPNPVQNGFAYLLNPDAIPLTWSLFSIDGRILKKGDAQEIQVGDLAAGMYLINLYAEDQMVSLKMLID